MQVLLVLSLASVALCQPPPSPRHSYKPSAEPKASHLPYQYQYGVKDDHSQSNFAKSEVQDEEGRVQGTFIIALPDGRIQTTKYKADAIHGFVAEVKYQGEAVYPAPPKDVKIFTNFKDNYLTR